MILNMNKIIIFIILILISKGIKAFEFDQKADIDSIKVTGFTKINLSPDIISSLNLNYGDIRIMDSRQKEVPYLLYVEPSLTQKKFFREFTLLENSTTPNQKLSRILIQNTGKKILSEIIFNLQNSDIQKEMVLKGSDDLKNWFIITHNYPENISDFDDKTTEFRSLKFPPSNYGYFEITIVNKKHDPLHILKAGYYDMELAKAYYTRIPSPLITQKDSARVSRIRLVFNKKYEISKLIWQISGPELYHRNCSLGNFIKSGKKEYFESYRIFQLSSKLQPVLDLDRFKADTLFMEIENTDNAPLKINGVEAYQMNIYLIASLNAGENYQLFFGNKELTNPEYDLKYFADLISDNIPVAYTKKPVLIKSEEIVKVKTSLLFNSKFLWIIIILVIGSLGGLSIKMIREMKSK
jgi:hypothetical protein